MREATAEEILADNFLNCSKISKFKKHYPKRVITKRAKSISVFMGLHSGRRQSINEKPLLIIT